MTMCGAAPTVPHALSSTGPSTTPATPIDGLFCLFQRDSLHSTRSDEVMKHIRTIVFATSIAALVWGSGATWAGVDESWVDDQTFLAGYLPLAEAYDAAWVEMVEAQETLDAQAVLLREAEIAFDAAEEEMRLQLVAIHRAITIARRDARLDAYLDAKFAYHAAAESMRKARDNANEASARYRTADKEWKRRGVELTRYNVDTGRELTFRQDLGICQEVECPNGWIETQTNRFHVFQPEALRMIKAGAAYDEGLTGEGVRIGIEDDTINILLSEFEDRVDVSGPARLTYLYPDGGDYLSDARRCHRLSVAGRRVAQCAVYDYDADSGQTRAERVAELARAGVLRYGDTVFLHTAGLSVYDSSEAPFVYQVVAMPDPARGHGTMVASTAAGRDFGVAPGATVVPLALPLGRDDGALYREQSVRGITEVAVEKGLIDFSTATLADWRELDDLLAEAQREYYATLDIINKSYGPTDHPWLGYLGGIGSLEDDIQIRQWFPKWWGAWTQSARKADERTIVVRAAGNEGELWPSPQAAYPALFPEMRGHHLTVIALDPMTREKASYSNGCGGLPDDWNRYRSGRHYCLAAPGTVNAVDFDGTVSRRSHEVNGTSFAAPVVSGAIALLMEHFRTGRGGLGNTAVARRVVDTADNSGLYAESFVYGAGLLDLETALRPVGVTLTGTSALSAPARTTVLVVPASLGNLGARFVAEGVEVARLDTLGGPFWDSPSRYLRHGVERASPLPSFRDRGGTAPDTLRLGFTPGTFAAPVGLNGLHLLAGAGRVGLESANDDGWTWGVLGDAVSWQGGQASGGFGSETGALTLWAGRTFETEMGDGWRVNGAATVAFGQPMLDRDAMLSIGGHMLSAWDVGAERGGGEGGPWWRVALSQPLRAETGHATLRYLQGLEDDQPAYATARAGLAPNGRELRLSLSHERALLGGLASMRLAHAWDAGHDDSRSATLVGFAWRVRW